jgi:hypothetical protein
LENGSDTYAMGQLKMDIETKLKERLTALLSVIDQDKDGHYYICDEERSVIQAAKELIHTLTTTRYALQLFYINEWVSIHYFDTLADAKHGEREYFRAAKREYRIVTPTGENLPGVGAESVTPQPDVYKESSPTSQGDGKTVMELEKIIHVLKQENDYLKTQTKSVKAETRTDQDFRNRY